MNTNKIRYNFGVKGWTVISFNIVMLFFMTGLTVDGLNIIVPQMAALKGWDANVLLSMSTPAGIIALFFVIFWGKLIDKFGLKPTTVVTTYLAALAVILYGHSGSIAMYAVTLVATVTLINAFSIICGFSICANWFPTQKGVVMGFVTIGMNLASALISLILNALSAYKDIAFALTVMGLVIAVVGTLIALFIKVTPEEAGCYPDNDPEVAELIHREEELAKDVKKIGYLAALKNAKVWIFGIAYGFFGLATVGIMSQLVGYFTDVHGFTLEKGIYMITLAAVIGIVGSIAWGIVDQKIGTKWASVLFGIWYFIGIILLIIPGTITMYAGLFMLGFAIGGNGNFAPSMSSLVFGRKDFAVCYSCVNTIVGVIRSMSFVMLAVLRGMTSGYTVPYLVFAVIALLGGVMLAFVNIKAHVGQSLEV